MKSPPIALFVLLLFVIGVGGGALLISQRSQSRLLRAEIDRAELATHELEQLRTQNQRLRAQQIPAGELLALRDDHAALPRLRAEVEALKSPPAASEMK